MVSSAVLAGLLAAAQIPEPPPPAAVIEWRAPPSCPDRAALRRGIEKRLGRSLRGVALGLEGVVTVHATAPLYRLTLRLRVGGGDERRTLGAETCSAVTDATAVLVALAVEASPRAPVRAPVAVDPPVVEAQPIDLPPPGPIEPPIEPLLPPAPPTIAPAPAPSATPTEPAPVEPPQPALEPRTRRRPGAFLRLHGGPELGALRAITGAVGLATGALWRRARLELQGLYLAPRTSDTPRGDLRASLAAGAIHGCARPGRGSLEIPLCGGLELGSMRAALLGGRRAQNLWLAAVVGAGVAVRVTPRLGLWTALQLVTVIVSPNFVARDPGPALPLFKPQTVTGRLLLGIEIIFADPR